MDYAGAIRFIQAYRTAAKVRVALLGFLLVLAIVVCHEEMTFWVR